MPRTIQINLTVPKEFDRRGLDAFIAAAARMEPGEAQEAIAFGCVKVDAIVRKLPSFRLTAGQHVFMRYDPAVVRAERRVEVVFEDEVLAVVAKRAGQPVQGTLVGSGNSIEEVLRERWGRSGVRIVHRLDLPVSGLMLVGKTGEAAAALTRSFEAHRVVKVYGALVGVTVRGQGWLEKAGEKGGMLSYPLRWVAHRQRAVVDVEAGRPSATEVRRLAVFAGSLALVSARLHTGRTHQARCHLAHAGLPILGDRVYGRLAPDAPERCGGEVQEAARIALHSTHLSFPHPATGELLVFDLAPPAEFWALGGLAADSWAGSFIDR